MPVEDDVVDHLMTVSFHGPAGGPRLAEGPIAQGEIL